MTREQHIFRAVWFGLFIAALLWEFAAMVNHGTMDTLSEYTRLKTAAWWPKTILGAALGWFVYHLLFAKNGTPLGWLDFVSVTFGAEIGFIAFYAQRVAQ